jgi:F0F1-type ATP synthase membrane subunit c/vacuolar-type H+-ATPase subunit K
LLNTITLPKSCKTGSCFKCCSFTLETLLKSAIYVGAFPVLLLTAVKYIVVGFSMLPISFAALGTGILFGTYNLAVAQNPEETENIFNTTLMGFALVETFVFLSFAVAALIFFV